jgi:hypothetical protein
MCDEIGERGEGGGWYVCACTCCCNMVHLVGIGSTRIFGRAVSGMHISSMNSSNSLFTYRIAML